jgi:DNA-binding NarL/FixJ family response regulator
MLSVVLVTRQGRLAQDVRDALAESATVRADVEPGGLAKAVADATPDVVVLAGGLGPREAPMLRDVRAACGDTPLVAIGSSDDPRAARTAVDDGAVGVVWESMLARTLSPTVACVAAGQLAVPADSRRHVQPPELTTREKQVLGMVVMGLSNGEIARNLYVSESTVKSHLSTAFRKLGVRSRAEAARMVADPVDGFGTGILAITGSGLAKTGRSGR